MTTEKFREDALERDNDLVEALCYIMEKNLVRDLREWIEAEIKALIFEAQVQRAEIEGVLGDQLDSAIERLRHISRSDLRDVVEDFLDAVHNAHEKIWSDVYNAYDPIQQGLWKLVQIVRMLLEIRELVVPVADE